MMAAGAQGGQKVMLIYGCEFFSSTLTLLRLEGKLQPLTRQFFVLLLELIENAAGNVALCRPGYGA
jgi:hypothetical protein